MTVITAYLRRRIETPLKEYADKHHQSIGQAINDLVEEKLKKEGYLGKQNV